MRSYENADLLFSKVNGIRVSVLDCILYVTYVNIFM